MPIESVSLVLSLDGQVQEQLFESLAVSNDQQHKYTLTSNQSGLSVSFGAVVTNTSLFIKCDQGITVSYSDGTLPLNSNGRAFIHRFSNSALTLTNDQTATIAKVTVRIYGEDAA